MNKGFKKVCLLSMVVAFLFSISLNIFAINCNLTFKLTVENGYTGNVAVVMTNSVSKKNYQFLLESNKGYNANDKYAIPVNATYNVTLTYPDSDKYKILNADGTEINSYQSTAAGLNLVWSMKAVSTAATNTTAPNVDTASSGNNAAANDMLNKFIEKTKFIESDSAFSQFLNTWGGAVYKNLYLQEKNATEDSWNKMSKYQQACYSLLYLYPKTLILGTNSNIFAKDRNSLIQNLDTPNLFLKQIPKGDVVYNALVEAWDWHWNNWQTKRVFINPFEGSQYGEKDKKESVNDFELSTQDKKTIEDGTEKRKELSSPNNFLSILQKNFITILILIACGVAFLVVYLKNKKKNHVNNDD